MTFVCYGCSFRHNKFTSAPTTRKRFKQLQLGVSEDGQLRLNGPVIEEAFGDLPVNDAELWVPTGENIIFRLADELIYEISKFAVAEPADEWPRNHYERALALAKVCKRFNRIVQPLLYQTIEFGNPCGLVPPYIPATRFHRTIKANPSLGRFCKQLKIYVSDIPGVKSINDYDIANELFCWLPNVTSLDIQGGFNGGNGPALWALIQRALGRMPLIEHVTLCREDIPGLLLLPIIEHLNLPRLKKLKIHGISGVTTGRNGENRQEHYGAQPKEGYQHTAPFTTLILSDFMEEPGALAHLLAWPKKLEHFTFERIHSNRVHWDLSTFEALLLPYRSTLKSISIGSLYGGGRTSIDISSFTELSILTLSRWQWDCTPEVASSTILAPKLHTFIWDFGVYDQHSEAWTDFAQEQVDWILKFAELAAAKKSKLRTIEILFNPDYAPHTRESYEELGYPWDLMDKLDVTMRPLEIKLKYSPMPHYTKQDIERKIEEREESLKSPSEENYTLE